MIDFSKPCESFEQACGEIMELALSSLEPRRGFVADCRPSFFRGMIPIHPRWVDWLFIDPKNELRFFAEDPEVLTQHIKGDPLDVSFCKRWLFDGKPGITFFRARTQLETRTLRGKVYPTNGHSWLRRAGVRAPMFQLTTLNVHGQTGRFDSHHEYAAFHNDRLALISKAPRGRNGPVPARGNVIAQDLMLGASMALTMRYEWMVRIGTEDSLSVGMPAQRDALADIFRLRDAPAGRSRRAALLNFVTQHWKRSRSQAPTEDPQVFVREHLRGQTKFNWNGLTCEVIPPKYDVERLQVSE